MMDLFFDSDVSAWAVLSILLALSIPVLVLINHTLPSHMAHGDDIRTRLFLAGGGVFAASFALTSSWDYRLIFLVLCVPYISSMASPVTRNAILGLIIFVSNDVLVSSALGPPGVLLGTLAKCLVFSIIAAMLINEYGAIARRLVMQPAGSQPRQP